MRVEIVGEETVVSVSGEIDIATVGQVRDALASLGTRDVVVDLADVSFMDTSALRLLVEQQRAAEETGASFAIARPHTLVRHLLDIAGLTDRLVIRDDRPRGDDADAG